MTTLHLRTMTLFPLVFLKATSSKQNHIADKSTLSSVANRTMTEGVSDSNGRSHLTHNASISPSNTGSLSELAEVGGLIPTYDTHESESLALKKSVVDMVSHPLHFQQDGTDHDSPLPLPSRTIDPIDRFDSISTPNRMDHSQNDREKTPRSILEESAELLLAMSVLSTPFPPQFNSNPSPSNERKMEESALPDPSNQEKKRPLQVSDSIILPKHSPRSKVAKTRGDAPTNDKKKSQVSAPSTSTSLLHNGQRISCIKHKKWKKRCPEDCAMRPTIGEGGELIYPPLPLPSNIVSPSRKSPNSKTTPLDHHQHSSTLSNGNQGGKRASPLKRRKRKREVEEESYSNSSSECDEAESHFDKFSSDEESVSNTMNGINVVESQSEGKSKKTALKERKFSEKEEENNIEKKTKSGRKTNNSMCSTIDFVEVTTSSALSPPTPKSPRESSISNDISILVSPKRVKKNVENDDEEEEEFKPCSPSFKSDKARKSSPNTSLTIACAHHKSLHAR